jgi:hypothetical protein
LQGESNTTMLKRRSPNDAQTVTRPKAEPVHPLVRDPSSLAALRHDIAEAKRQREPWDVDGTYTYTVGAAPAVGFNSGGTWGGTQ